MLASLLLLFLTSGIDPEHRWAWSQIPKQMEKIEMQLTYERLVLDIQHSD